MESKEWIQLRDFLENADDHLEPEEDEPIVFGGNIVWEIIDCN